MKRFPIGHRLFQKSEQFIDAVDDVSFQVRRGETLALVGESGSGKTTLGRLIAGSLSPTSGRIRLDGRAQMIFQDPYGALSPRMRVLDIVAEPLAARRVAKRSDRHSRVADALERVGLAPAHRFLRRFPHELSGGQRQRVAMARAIVDEPTLIVADEPTSMLDVSERARVLRWIERLKHERRSTWLYMTHDLAVARYLGDRIAVMHGGKIVEIGPGEEVIRSPLHPLARALVAAVPTVAPFGGKPNAAPTGEMRTHIDPKRGCRFFSRCPAALPRCKTDDHPPLEQKGPDRYVACYLA